MTNGTSSLMGGGSTKNSSSLSRIWRRTQKQGPHLTFLPFPQSCSQNRGSRRAMMISDGSQSGESFGSVNVRLHIHIIISSIRYRRSANESKTNPRIGKRVLRPTTAQPSRPSKKNPSQKDEQRASASLGPVLRG